MTQSATARTKDAGQPAQVGQAGDAQATAAQPNGAAQPSAAPDQPFAAWLGSQAQAAALAAQAGLPADGTDARPVARADGAAADDSTEDGASAAAQPQDGALLAAMAMPLMPLTPMQVAQAVQAAQPSGAQSGDDAEPAAGTPAVAAVGTDGAVRQSGGAAQDHGQGLSLPQLANAPAARPAQAESTQAVRLAVHAQAEGNGANSGAQDSGAEHANANTTVPSAALAGALVAQPASNAPAADTVKLAGPPTAWRQSLQEALGERMNVQVGKGIEQAVIRLEPPQLGRIDIAIRHSAGMLEVNITATNGEVLRQLQNVSDNLRSDLSQRQFTEVAVTVAPPQKNGAAPFGDPQQGRGRNQDRGQEDQQPGRALAEADNQSSGFSLG